MKTYDHNGMVVKLSDDQNKLFEFIMRIHQAGGAMNKFQIASNLGWDHQKVDTVAAELVSKGLIGAHKP